MKKDENLASTNQLIRFIRGDVKHEDFYDHQTEPEVDKKSPAITYGLPVVVGLLLILVGYLFLSWQLRAYQAQFLALSQSLETARDSFEPELEAKRLFWQSQEALYKNLVGEKLSMSCLLKELTHISPVNISLRRIFLKKKTQQPEGSEDTDKDLILADKDLTLEGMVIKREAYVDGDFPTFLTQLNQSPFFQKVQVNHQKYGDTDYGHGLSFVLTCDLR